MNTTTATHTTGTRKALGLDYGQTVTIFHAGARTADGTVTGTVAKYPGGWHLVGHNNPGGHFVVFSHSTPVTVVR